MPHPTLKISSPSLLSPYLPLLSDQTLDPSVRTTLQKAFTRHLRLLHPNDRPQAPLDTALAARVDALQTRASQLSILVIQTRTKALSSIQSLLPPRIAAINPPPESPPSPISKPSQNSLQPLVDAAASVQPTVVNRVATVAKGVASTKKRAASVRQVLKILSENVALDRDTSKTIADDWTLNFSDLPQKRRRVEPIDEDDSPLPVKSGSERVFLAISPHITPRSKMRKRLLRSGKRSDLRQPSFSPLPR